MTTTPNAAESARRLSYMAVGVLVSQLFVNGLHWWLMRSLWSGDGFGDGPDDALAIFGTLSPIGQGALLTAEVGMALALLGFSRARPEARALRLAAVLQGGGVAISLPLYGAGLFQVALPAAIQRPVYGGLAVVGLVATAAVLVGVHQSRRALGSRAEGAPLTLAASALGATALMFAARFALSSDLPKAVFDALPPLSLGLNLLANGALVWLLRVHAGALALGVGPTGTLRPTAPSEAAVALNTFTNTLIARVVLVVGGVVLALIANFSHSVPMAKFVGHAVPLASIVLGLIMLVALVQLARRLGAGAGQARLAATLMTLGLGLDGYGLKLAGDLFSGRLGRALSATKVLPWVQGVAQVIGLGAMLALISAFSAIALSVGDARLRAEGGTVRVFVVITAALALGVRGFATMRRPPVALVLVFGILALVMAISALARFVAMSRATALALAADAEDAVSTVFD